MSLVPPSSSCVSEADETDLFSSPSLAPTANFSVEIHPKRVADLKDLSLRPRERLRVFLPHLHVGAAGEQIGAAQAIVALGFTPVAHVAARGLPDRDALGRHLDELAAVGVRDLLLIGGSQSPPHGTFASVSEVLETGLIDGDRFATAALAGHPEGGDYLPMETEAEFDALLQEKLAKLNALGCRGEIVTQFLFDSTAAIAWVERLRKAGIAAPIRLGLAGPANAPTLLNYAIRCGVGPSIRVLRKEAKRLGRLLSETVPEPMISNLEAWHRTVAPDRGIAGLHFYPFGGIRRLNDWLASRTEAETTS